MSLPQKRSRQTTELGELKTQDKFATKKSDDSEEVKILVYPEENKNSSFPYENFDCDLVNCKEYLNEHGVAVVEGVLTQQEVETARDEMFDLLEHMLSGCIPPFSRDDPATWRSFSDLIPMHGMLL